MLQIGICDDMSDVRMKLRVLLERLLEAQRIQCQIFEFSSGEGLLSWYQKHSGELDLVFLDIEMGGSEVAVGGETLPVSRAYSTDALLALARAPCWAMHWTTP